MTGGTRDQIGLAPGAPRGQGEQMHQPVEMNPSLRRRGLMAVVLLALTSIAFAGASAVSAAVVAAAGNDIAFRVVDAHTGNAIPAFKYLVNVDNTGTTEQRAPITGCSPETVGYPASCH